MSTAIERTEGSRLRITGRLTMGGVTQDIALDGRIGDAPASDRLTLGLCGSLSHRAFGIGTQALAANRVILAHKVRILAELSIVRFDVTEEEA